ncbi:MMPL family transporter [Thalassospira lucentensis]|uniref:MMPL family transporter n=1 Tax=Thalassospira lucentensis TaxID=168935 RepID=UPI00399D64C0
MAVRGGIWGIFLLIMVTSAIWQVTSGSARIDGDVLSLIGLEKTDDTARKSDIETVRDLLANDANQAIIMVSANQQDMLETATRALASDIANIPGTKSVSMPGYDSGNLARLSDFYLPHAQSLLSDRDRALLRDGNGEPVYQNAVKTLYAPASMVSAASLRADPFSLLPNFLAELGNKLGPSGIVQRDNLFHSPIIISLTPDLRRQGRDIAWVGKVNDVITNAQNDTNQSDGLTIAKTGQVFFAVAEATAAKADVQRIAIIATLGIFAMVLSVFFSPLPLIGTLITVGSGLIAGIAAITLIFDGIHAIALVFGASLIGISVDYALHYLVLPADEKSPTARIATIRSGLSLGLLTSVCGFAVLAISPAILLAQIAVYSIAGLIAAYVTVLFVLPLLPARSVKHRSLIPRVYQKLDDTLRRLRLPRLVRGMAALAILGGFAICILFIPTDDDIRHLGHGNDTLTTQARLIGDTMGMGGNPAFIRIDGADSQSRLQTGEAVQNALRPLIKDGTVGSAFGLSDMIPSIKRQDENRILIKDQLFEAYAPKLAPLIPINIQTPNPDAPYLHADEDAFAQFPELANLRDGMTDIVRLNAVTDANAVAMAIANIDAARLINPRATITDQFSHYRNWATVGLAIALLSAGILAIARYGMIRGLCVLGTPAGAMLVALGGAATIGITINFFTIMALFLVFAIGADYVIFFSESQKHGQQDATRFAVFLSLISSILAFGLLASSSVPVVSAIGTIMAIGLPTAWVLSYAMCPTSVKADQSDV